MVDVRGDVLRPPHGTTPAAVKSNIKSEMRSFKSNENIHKKEGGSYYVVSANKPVKRKKQHQYKILTGLEGKEANVNSTGLDRTNTHTNGPKGRILSAIT